MIERIFNIRLKNDQIIELRFTSIEVANNQLWQMFATTQALDTVQQLIDIADTTQTKSARKTAPEKSVPPKNKK